MLGSPIVSHAALARKVAGDLVFWDQTRGYQDIQNNLSVFSEVSPFWYTLDAAGTVVPYTNNGVSVEDPSIVSYLHSHGIMVTATVTNLSQDGVWQGSLVSQVISNSTSASTHITALVNLITSKGYDGLDLDYENLTYGDRAAFSTFVQNLATALHAAGKTLSVNVYGKTSEPGSWGGQQSEDWLAIGKAADEVRIMAYEYSWSTSPPGPVSPIWWVNHVLSFALSEIPPAKIMHGIPLYGYDWPNGSSATDHVWTDLMSTASKYGATALWDTTSASPWYQYSASGISHTVWFDNASSTDAKLAASNTYNVGGVFLWRLGGEDPATWPTVRLRFAGSATTTGDTQAPVVAITSPVSGATLVAKQNITATASDNVGVTKVEFYTDGKLLGTFANAPYSTYWNTRKLSVGQHTIKATAYDAAGNIGSAQVSVYKSLASAAWELLAVAFMAIVSPVEAKLEQAAAVTALLPSPPPR